MTHNWFRWMIAMMLGVSVALGLPCMGDPTVPAAWATGDEEEEEEEGGDVRALVTPDFVGDLAALPPNGQPGPTNRAYVSNEKADTVTVIDTRTDRVVRIIAVGRRPRGIGISPDRSRLYVATSNEDAIEVIDLKTYRFIGRMPGGSDPEAFAVHPDGKRLFLSNEDSASATALDVTTGKVLKVIRVDIEPEGVGASPDGKWVYVTNESTH